MRSSILDDLWNKVLYRDVGTVKDNILTSYDVGEAIIEVTRYADDTVNFNYCIPISPISTTTIADVTSNTVSVNKKPTFWDLSQPDFVDAKHVKINKYYLDVRAYLLKRLFKEVVPDIDVGGNAEDIIFNFSPSLRIEFIENKDSVLSFKFIFSSSLHDYMIRTVRFKTMPLSTFDGINDKTTLNIIREGGMKRGTIITEVTY